jgi:hypothetical protein
MRFQVPMPAILLLLGAVLLLDGCSEDKKAATAPVPEDPRKTIAGVMQEIIDSYEARSITRYSALFDQDDFMFVFDVQDVYDQPDIPPNWDWPDELVSNRNMFASPLVERIQLDFVVGAPVAVVKEDIGERPFPEGTMKVAVSEVDFTVDTQDPDGGENLLIKVAGDRAHFFLFPDSNEVVDGIPVWKIFEWRDERIGRGRDGGPPLSTRGAHGSIESSWGTIKFIFGLGR